MNLTTSTEEVARRLGARPDDVQPVIETFLKVVGEALASGVAVTFRCFGTFTPAWFKPHKGCLSHPTINFRPSSPLKRLMGRRP